MTDSITKESKYQCDHDLPAMTSVHVLEFICSGCLKALVNRHNLMFEFVKSISDSNDDIFFNLSMRAEKLLKEIGEADE